MRDRSHTTPTGRRSVQRRSFQTEYKVYCRRVVHWNDRTFAVGDEFPWEEMGVPPRKVQLLFRSRKVTHMDFTKPGNPSTPKRANDGDANGQTTETKPVIPLPPDGSVKHPDQIPAARAAREEAAKAVEEKPGPEAKPLDGMTLAELREIAKRDGVPIKPTKPLQLAAIKAKTAEGA